MKRYFILFLMIMASLRLFSQNERALIKAENAFEKASLEKGIREGFLSFADSTAIVFGEKGPENAKHFWESLNSFDGIFSWSPTYAEISLTGDWGYTTGNYEHRPKLLADKPDRFGQYTTVWQKDVNGIWKYLIDIGNTHPSAPLDKEAGGLVVEKTAGTQTTDSFLMNLEEKFIAAFENKPEDAYRQYISAVYIMNLSGINPVRNRDSAVMMITRIYYPIKFHPAGWKTAPGKDMAAVYGTIAHGNDSGKYLRIWRHEKSGWKIALEVISH